MTKPTAKGPYYLTNYRCGQALKYQCEGNIGISKIYMIKWTKQAKPF